jgi:hypothetical protein
VILLAEHDEPTLAAKKKRQLVPLATATSTSKTRVWGFENTPSGRPNIEAGSSWENATGSVQYTYRNASGRAEWQSRDPLPNPQDGANESLYEYAENSPIILSDPIGLDPFGSGKYHGNWGGAGYANGKLQSEESNFLDGQKLVPPTDDRDACYEHHDFCLHNCATIKDPVLRRNCRNKCDNDLAACISKCKHWWWQKPFEEHVFSGPNSYNAHPDKYYPGAKYYPPPK